MDVIETENLAKAYGDLQVLRGVNLRVAEQQVYGLLGPNGVGKSTLLHVLLGFLKPSDGSLRVLGSSDLEHVRGRIGYVPERQRYHVRFSAREYLRFLGQFSDLNGAALRQQVERQLERVGLTDAADQPLATYSKGMLQRFGIAQALLNDPELLVVDEPSSGLDPAGQREVIELMATLRAQGHTIFLCTHYLAEVEALCDRVGVLAHGKIAAEAVVAQLRGPATSVSIQVNQIAPELRLQLNSMSSAVQCGESMIVLQPNTDALQAAVLRLLLDHQVSVLALKSMERPLERLYIQAVRGEPPDSDGLTLPNGIAAPEAQAPVTPRAPEGDVLLNELLRRMNDNAGSGDERSRTETQGEER